MQNLFENWRRFLLKEADEVLSNGDKIIIFSDWAQGHITRGHTEPGQGSVFKKVDMSVIMTAVESAPVESPGGVYTTEASEDIGYDLVLPMSEAMALEDAQRVTAKKEERGGIIEVVGIKTSRPLEKFASKKLSVVIRPSTMQYVPDSLKQDPEVQAAEAEKRLYGVLAAWPGRGDVPPASKWGEEWAVILPS